MKNVRSPALVVAMLASLLGGCGKDEPSANATPAIVAASAPAPVAELPPLTGAEICSRLNAATVSKIIGFEVTEPKASTSMTPQCSYPYKGTSGGSYNVTVAFQRPDGDLMGRRNQEAFDYVATLQRGNLKVNPGATEVSVTAGQQALRFSGINRLHYGMLLVSGRLLTVTAFAESVEAAAVDRLLVEVAQTFAR